MSHIATNWAFEQRGLKPSAKIILLVLADCHNPANGCFPSQHFLADACEMSRATVNVQLAHLEELKLIRRVRSINPDTKCQRPTRYKLAFEVDFGCDPEGEAPPTPRKPSPKKPVNPVSEKPTRTPEAVSEKPAKPCLKYGQSRVQNRDTNLVKEPVSEPCVGGTGAAHPPIGFDKFWESFPRTRNRIRCQEIFQRAVTAGTTPEEIQIAADRYKAENVGNKTMYVAYADNWLDQRRWEDYQAKPAVVSDSNTVRDAAIFWAAKVKAGKYIPQNAFGAEIADCMLQSGLVQQQDLLRAGVRM